jgi:UDP-N-acetylglucosamine 2-epimerase (non-hydrolysing)
MNRRLITQLASYHMAATRQNVATLLAEGVAKDRIFLTGNPVVDTLHEVLRRGVPTDKLRALLSTLGGRKLIALTTHRRESFGAVLRRNLSILNEFVAAHAEVALVFPIHPNPSVRKEVSDILKSGDRIYLIDPLVYPDFIALLRQCWLIVSDSGGVQEEAPTLGKPVIVLRSNTERPEAVECGCARLLGPDPEKLRDMLEDAIRSDAWTRQAASLSNPFGDGRAAERIVNEIGNILGHRGGSAGMP